MPILTLQECFPELETEGRRSEELFGSNKPTVCIFDALIGFHWPFLEPCFGKLTNLFNIVKFEGKSFSGLEIERGSIGPNLTIDNMAMLKPALIISDLVIAPMTVGDGSYGIKMLTNLFGDPRLDKTGFVVISDFFGSRHTKLLESFIGSQLSLRVNEIFNWESLRNQALSRRFLYNYIFHIYARRIPDRPNLNPPEQIYG